jgi:hypothetical protein
MSMSAERPNIFLGCSTESSRFIAPVIQAILAEDALVQIFSDDFFEPGKYVLESLVERVDRYDFAILLFTADDLAVIRGNEFLVARDNTVLEAGFFIGKLGRERTFVMVPNLPNLRLPTDLAGLTTIRFPSRPKPEFLRAELGPACQTIRNAVEKLGPCEHVLRHLTPGMKHILRKLKLEDDLLQEPNVAIEIARVNRAQLDARDIDVCYLGISSEGSEKALGFVKAAQYCLAFLTHLGLVRHIYGYQVAGFQLTERGNRLVDDVLNRPLCVGDRSDEVKLLQKRLQIRVDGVFGEQTRDAVINFQLGNGLIPDGVVGPQTRLHLIF